MEDFRNIIIERGGAGIPWAELPANIANANAMFALNPDDPANIEAKASYDTVVSMLESICQDTQKYIVTPQMWDDKTGKEQIKVSFLQPNMGADIVGHITESIRTEANSILMSTMTEFLTLGTGATGGGSLALSRDKTDNFQLSIEAYLDAFQNSFNNQLVPQLFKLNPQFEDIEELPKLIHEPVVPLSVGDVSLILGLFEKTGWEMKSQSTIRDSILQSVGLPDYEEQTALESDAPTEGDGKPKAEAIQQIVQNRAETKKSARKARRERLRDARYGPAESD